MKFTIAAELLLKLLFCSYQLSSVSSEIKTVINKTKQFFLQLQNSDNKI